MTRSQFLLYFFCVYLLGAVVGIAAWKVFGLKGTCL
jgi:hypothetical protein